MSKFETLEKTNHQFAPRELIEILAQIHLLQYHIYCYCRCYRCHLGLHYQPSQNTSVKSRVSLDPDNTARLRRRLLQRVTARSCEAMKIGRVYIRNAVLLFSVVYM